MVAMLGRYATDEKHDHAIPLLRLLLGTVLMKNRISEYRAVAPMAPSFSLSRAHAVRMADTPCRSLLVDRRHAFLSEV